MADDSTVIKTLSYPFTLEKVRSLREGEIVRLSGRVFTGRDRLHKELAASGTCAVDLRDSAMYHCGPVVIGKPGSWRVCSAGPTTSIRMEPYTRMMVEDFGVRIMIGKGGMGEGTRKLCAEHGSVYLHAVGGAGSLLASTIQQVNGVHYIDEFGSAEAMWDLSVENLEALVTIDARGRSLHRRIASNSRKALKGLVSDP